MSSPTEHISNQNAELMDRKIIEFFGSVEEFKAQAHLYVLQAKDSEIAFKPETNTYTLTQEYRIRLKTLEELTAEKEAQASQDLHPL